MNKKLLLQDLTDQLSELGHLKKKDADEFLKAFFKVIEESLFEGEVVKIPGLGIFKLIQVDSRKSVNVSTGEEIEIKEHYKIGFSPDQALKDQVNTPFSYLEPVQLDGNLEDNKRYQPKSESDKKIIEESESEEEENNPQTSKVIKYESMPQNNKDSENQRVSDNTRNQLKNDIKSPIPPPKKVTRPTYEKPKPSLENIFWIALLLIVVILAGWGIISNRENIKEKEHKAKNVNIQLPDSDYYESDSPEDYKNSIDDSLAVEAEIAAKLDSLSKLDKSGKTRPAVATKPTVKKIVVKLDSKQSVKPEVVITRPEVVKSTSKPLVAENKNTSTKANGSSDKFPVTLTMQKGDRLTLLALKYYGNKVFWVYIYATNRSVIPDPNNVAIGTTIRISKPDPARINANDPECIEKAKALQTKIMTTKNQ